VEGIIEKKGKDEEMKKEKQMKKRTINEKEEKSRENMTDWS
jgi:hypothetical protein